MKGFTLIELLVGFAIMAIIAMISISSFGTYSTSQGFVTAVSDFSSLLSTARSRAISQVKPASCAAANPLVGYKVTVSILGQDYSQYAVCLGISDVLISTKKLPGQVKFVSGQSSILFDVATGTVLSPGSITISGYGKSSIVNIDKSGNISLQ